VKKKGRMEFRLLDAEPPWSTGIWNIPVPALTGAPVPPGNRCWRRWWDHRNATGSAMAEAYVISTARSRRGATAAGDRRGLRILRLDTIYPQPFDQPMSMIVTRLELQP